MRMTDDELFDAVLARVREGRPADSPHRDALPGPAALAEVEVFERIVGCPMPPLLRRIYLEIGDGGIGPFDGISALQDEDEPMGMLNAYVEYLTEELDPEIPPPPPAGVLFFCDMGCAQWFLLDCRHPDGQMWWWEEGDRHKLDLTFPQWLESWLRGQTWTGRDGAEVIDSLKLSEESWVGPGVTEGLVIEVPDNP
ncbi:SMI1/KNR4 family protein [Streptomyces sp. TRM66268-LWL]|uniref:SMI1/KNR4 family protein n=1 Tax=Streptomyces polyasparticus TaxID=2767826 RepID=A0ABR7SKU9_9ACTN|nr:SMI1/KNR4 family protein [Streptomyces polyasparticus]MBC9714958.1 SMI1/KNR4 family protein [Streptomyces polyasparticus]